MGLFNIELGKDFPKEDRAMANMELGLFNKLTEVNMGMFNKAWSGWPKDETAPQANRSDSVAQSMLDMSLKIAFKDLYK